MLTGLARIVLWRPRAILVIAALLVVVAAIWGAGAVPRLKAGGFDRPDAEASQAAALLRDELGLPSANIVALVRTSGSARLDDPDVTRIGTQVADRFAAQPGVRVLTTYWSATGPAKASLRSRDGSTALVVAHIDGDEDSFAAVVPGLSAAVTSLGRPQVSVQTGGFAQAIVDITGQVKKDMAAAEAIAIPVTLVLLMLTFGSVIGGLLPLLVGGIAMVATLAVLRTMSLFTEVSVFSLNLTTALGLGLGIDYALIMVTRFREALAEGLDVPEALVRTVHTAGRTVAFSAGTIAVALAALLAFPMYFLRSFAYAGISVVAVTALASLLILPAVLAVLGQRANRSWWRGSSVGGSGRWWAGIARLVTRRPVLTGLPVVLLLAIMALPLTQAAFGLPDDRALPPGSSAARQVGDVLREGFGARASEAIQVVFPTSPSIDELTGYALAASRLASVARIEAPTGTYVAGQRVGPGHPELAPRPSIPPSSTPHTSVPIGSEPKVAARTGPAAAALIVPAAPAYDRDSQDLLAAVRALPAPAERLIGGPTARFVEVNDTIAAQLPLVAGLIGLSTLVLLFLFTGSVVIPIKALAVNVLAIGAVSGAMVWVFQLGHGADLLGFTPGPLSVSIPPLMFCLAFGLSMDYEVFLLARITEAYHAGASPSEAVAEGLRRTGRLVSAAAGLMSVTFLAFSTSRVSFIQMLGLGCALAVVLDATLIRGVFVPAMMRLLGGRNWWAPPFLRRLHDRVGVREQPRAGGRLAGQEGRAVGLVGAQAPGATSHLVPARTRPE